ncbi:hypothetical protein DL96DRAFT_303529 [Flagelloscypha sp. PMI_526]|nr:hypothetical protein DL96DRAFT_303529 [Flagelloscypha sp. PMI_526]
MSLLSIHPCWIQTTCYIILHLLTLLFPSISSKQFVRTRKRHNALKFSASSRVSKAAVLQAGSVQLKYLRKACSFPPETVKSRLAKTSTRSRPAR